MAANIGTASVKVNIEGSANRHVALEHAVTLRLGDNAQEIVEAAKEFQAYLDGND